MVKGVEFYEDSADAIPRKRTQKNLSSLVQKIIQWGWVKDEKQANIILIVISLTFLAVSAVLIFFNNQIGVSAPPVGTPDNFIP